MTIKLFSHYYGGWYEQEVETLDDVIDALDQEDQARLPEKNEIDKKHRDHMYTWDELVERFEGVTVFG